MASEFLYIAQDENGVYIGLPAQFGEFRQGVHFFRGANLETLNGIDQNNGFAVAGVMRSIKKGLPHYDTTSGVRIYETTQIGDSK